MKKATLTVASLGICLSLLCPSLFTGTHAQGSRNLQGKELTQVKVLSEPSRLLGGRPDSSSDKAVIRTDYQDASSGDRKAVQPNNDGTFRPAIGSCDASIEEHWKKHTYLGAPTQPTDQQLADGGRFRDYAAGSIYLNPKYRCAFVVRLGFWEQWNSEGRQVGVHGYPVSDELPSPANRSHQYFDKGSMWWTASTGTYELHGPIAVKHYQLISATGYPTMTQSKTADGIGEYVHLETDTSIFWSPRSGAWSVRLGIRAQYEQMGWERSWLGYPVSDEQCNAQGECVNSFQGGAIHWSSAAGVRAVRRSPSETTGGIGSKTQGIASLEGKFEFAIDAPWRMEPSGPPVIYFCDTGDAECERKRPLDNPYGLVPIQISVHDVNLMWHDRIQYTTSLQGPPAPAILGELGQFRRIEVEEDLAGVKNTTDFDLNHVHEVEFTEGSWPWPEATPPATPVIPPHRLCRVWKGETCGPEFQDFRGKSEWHSTLFYKPHQNKRGERVRLTVRMFVSRRGGSNYAPLDGPRSDVFTLESSMSVYLGEAPLPRFDRGWMYGDLHYHSQGTDNEGESAYSYRGVLQAMRAMGLDFLFATDHASNSEQTVDIDVNITGPASLKFGLRDMSPNRFVHSLDWLKDANREVRSADPGKPAPQIFLGGEVDVIPEVSAAEQLDSTIRYGNNLKYDYSTACDDVPFLIRNLYGGCVRNEPNFPHTGPIRVPSLPRRSRKLTAANLELRVDNGSRFLIKDVQGKNEFKYFARQHFLHLPDNYARRDTFVESRTSEYGGAQRRLKDVIAWDYELHEKGSFFLAHPLSRSSGSGFGRMGPDLVPYTEVQLKDAFQSRFFLGLQIWNEDTHLSTEMGKGDALQTDYGHSGVHSNLFAIRPWYNKRTDGWQKQGLNSLASKLHHGSFTWDKMLRWGLDPAMTSSLPWLSAGQPRRVFAAAGSDAHGDLNFRREGAVTGTDAVTDTAIGKPRVLLFAGEAPEGFAEGGTQREVKPHRQETIMRAIRDGNFSITDGPAVRIAVDVNGNKVIDDQDVPMGGLKVVSEGEHIPLLVEWLSTPEFGAVTRIDLYLGAFSSQNGVGVTYAPVGHGIRGDDCPSSSPALSIRVSPAPGEFTMFKDGYWLDPYSTRDNHNLLIWVSRDNRYHGIAQRLFIPSWFWALSVSPSRPPTASRADRFYVRAFVRTSGEKFSAPDRGCAPTSADCMERFAMTNPIWFIRQ